MTDGDRQILNKLEEIRAAGLGGGGGGGGGLTDAEIRASPLPVSIPAGDLEVGAVEIKNAGDDTRARVGALSSSTASDNGLSVTDPLANAILGTTVGAKVITDANGTVQQYLRGLVSLISGTITVVLDAASSVVGLPTSLGQKTAANSTSVVLASDRMGGANLSSAQVTASTSAATLVIARATRRKVTIKNKDAAISVYVGPATVTAANSMELKAGESFAPTWVGLIQVLAASGSPVVQCWDEYD